MDQTLSFANILLSAYNDSVSTVPIFFILSAGADPTEELKKLGDKLGYSSGGKFWSIALG